VVTISGTAYRRVLISMALIPLGEQFLHVAAQTHMLAIEHLLIEIRPQIFQRQITKDVTFQSGTVGSGTSRHTDERCTRSAGATTTVWVSLRRAAAGCVAGTDAGGELATLMRG
jgi:hypothetical protein